MRERPRPPSPPTARLDRAIGYLFPRWGLKRQDARLRIEMATQFRGAGAGRMLADWASQSFGVLTVNPQKWEMEALRTRTQELNRNDPVAAAITETLAVNVIGQGLRPQSRLRAEVLGIDEKQAQKLRQQAENIFELWAPFADASNRLDFNEIQLLAFRKIIEDGEILIVPGWVDEPGRPLKRALELVEAERLGTPYGITGTFQGLELGEERKEPVKYWIRKKDISKNDYELPSFEWVGIPARDAAGRPMVIHTFPTKRPGQLRGIPFFAPALPYFKHLGDYIDAALITQKLMACLAIFITRSDANNLGLPLPTMQGETQPDGRSTTNPLVEPGSITPLLIGEDIKVVDPKRTGETFQPFVESVLRIIGVSVGLPYELLLKDFSKTNYSSARAALLESRRHFNQWRNWFGRKFNQPIWELVLEEAMLRGFFQVRPQDFYANRAEYVRAFWIGAGYGWVDPVKEKEAAKLGIDWCIDTYASVAAEQGDDWEELLVQRAREEARIKDLGLVIPEARAKQVAQVETAPLPGAPGGGQ